MRLVAVGERRSRSFARYGTCMVCGQLVPVDEDGYVLDHDPRGPARPSDGFYRTCSGTDKASQALVNKDALVRMFNETWRS